MKRFFSLFVFIILNSHLSFATNEIQIEGIATQRIHKTSTKKISLNAQPGKLVTVLKLNFSEKAKQAIQNHVVDESSNKILTQQLPHQVQLGMSNVPVLDQGIHGTCATFATIGALDAMRGAKDYYSELCLLNLGKHISTYGFQESGWNGQNPDLLLDRIFEYGLVPKHIQKSVGCGGATEYPVNAEDSSNTMSIEEYHQYSEPAYYSGLELWSSILDISKFFSNTISKDEILQQTKHALYHGNRVIIGVLLPLNENLGLSGHYRVNNDTWILTAKLEQAAKYFIMQFGSWGGHAMILTGYDDNAIVVDDDGISHQGVFTLRNSWGNEVGDKGNFYMTYDYFQTLSIELIELINVTP
ncbi:MAG: peptidase C1 [Gammaproteobacteria bacterium]|nr:peptidase C1 [Gammaproteobacteria bacterium]